MRVYQVLFQMFRYCCAMSKSRLFWSKCCSKCCAIDTLCRAAVALLLRYCCAIAALCWSIVMLLLRFVGLCCAIIALSTKTVRRPTIKERTWRKAHKPSALKPQPCSPESCRSLEAVHTVFRGHVREPNVIMCLVASDS